ncbi:mitochondrial fission process protein 1 [Pectinophora gossypiella]|uniref:mitochondrial fission process protein 1 n=1 Tax=Pectinophora gossypiella TaxID=13191 RepID=UPI00214F2C14|nr:mitochondrial fission process protein 1 [Pectinophora gossypiella]
MARKDFFRDTWIRYLGYANEVGEAFRPLIERRFVNYSYGLAFGYVLADTTDKALQKFWHDGRLTKVLWATGDALIWQSLASIIIPGIVINRIVAYSNVGLKKYAPKIPRRQRLWMTVGIGIMSIPIIVSPIDHSVHFLMNITYRQIFK